MKIAVLLKSGPCTDNAERAFKTALSMVAQGHEVILYLLQEAVRFCNPGTRCSGLLGLGDIIEKGIKVYVLGSDAKLRGVDFPRAEQRILEGSYDSLVDLMESSDRVVGIL